MRRLALLVTLLAGVPRLAQATDPPMQPAAKALYDEAMARYAARDYHGAIPALQAAYALDPRREILFAQAQATRLSGDCSAALPIYERFLATNPPPSQVEATRIAVARCRAPATTGIEAALPPRPSPPTVLAPLAPAPAAWYRDRLAGALTGAGVVTIGVGAALLASAHSADADARAVRTSYQDAQAAHDRAAQRWDWGLGATLVGSALLAAGLGRYVWVQVHPQGAGAIAGAGARF